MDMLCTETFEQTWNSYKECSNQYEIDNNTLLHIEPLYKYRQIVSMGGSRSSKSYSILQLLLTELVSRKRIKITVWRKEQVVCRDTVMEDFINIIMFNFAIFRNFKINKQKATFLYVPTGSKIVFNGADSVGKVLGGTQDISFFNEVTEFSEEVYLQIRQRTSDRIFCDYNPSKNFWLERYRHDEETVFIHSTFKDNKFCPPNIVKDLLAYEPWEPGSYEVKGFNLIFNGKPITPKNQPPPHVKNTARKSCNEYMWLVYGLGIGAEKPNKIYRGWIPIDEEEWENQEEYTSYFGIDFGTSAPTAVMEVKFDGNGAFYIRKRMYKPLQEIDDSLVTIIKLKVPEIDKGNSMIVGDSAKQSYINLLTNAGHFAIGAVKGAGSVEVGITLIQGFTIYYVPSEDLDDEYSKYSWEIDRHGKSTDKPLKVDDHLMDAMRYIINYLVMHLGIEI